MLKIPFLQFSLAGVDLSSFGMKIPSPMVSLALSNSQIASMTSWTLTCNVGGDSDQKINVAAMEGLLYQAAQSADSSTSSSGIPVNFSFGWLDEYGNVASYISYQGFTLKFQVSTNGTYMTYVITGYASVAIQASQPVLRIPELHGIVQPSAVVEALAKAVKATTYYDLDIDHNDAPTLVSHGALNTSFNRYVRGELTGDDDYDSFPGLLRLSKSYSSSRDAAGVRYPYKNLHTITNVVGLGSQVKPYLTKSLTDNTVQCTSFSYWIDEPTMTKQGVIHYKSNAGLLGNYNSDVLQIGTANTNILSLSGSYNGIAYNMTDMNFKQLGFTVDTSGQTIVNNSEVVNSWSSSLEDVYQSANIINDVNAIASQFSGDFTVQIPGSVSKYDIAQPVSLLVVTGNTISPVTGIYNIVSVSHAITTTFITTLKLQRLTVSTANQVAADQNIFVQGSTEYRSSYGTYTTTSNIKSPYKVDFGELYPTFEHMQQQMI